MNRGSTPPVARIAALAVVMVLAFAPSAFAQDGSAGATYAGPGGNTQQQVSAGEEGGPTADKGDGLPFTGLDLALAIGGGLVLLATGVAISRVVARDETV